MSEKDTGRVLFTKEMKKTHTILVPSMAPIHFAIVKNVLVSYGYRIELLDNQGPSVVQEGLKYVHNDTCYPALLVIGQMIDALNSGKYDVDHTALIITQTGGGCRASNYIHLLRKALRRAGYAQVPVISLNLSGLEKNSGFTLTLPMIRKFVAGVVYGDALMLLRNQLAPYELFAGQTESLVQKWIGALSDGFAEGRGYKMKEISSNLRQIAKEFSEIPVGPKDKVRVGIVGEIYVKYASLGNNHLEEFLASQNCEVMVPGLMGFALFKTDNRLEDIRLYGGNPLKKMAVKVLFNYLTKMETAIIDAVKEHPNLIPPSSYRHTKELVRGVIGYGNKMGEGWLLTGEMIELVEQGFENIVCTQPFGCLPNHICGKGMIRKIKTLYPNANIVPIDYDPSATRVNQENRIKLMLSVAAEQMADRGKGAETNSVSTLPAPREALAAAGA
ncbi:MAG TPA: 2-hydroxyacyl-CoA dehydratase [Candidatus Fimivivens faecavium]|nr:2-hydroxyacyl-CoA dehydratase [Candidatus Fimivivens faecavium]